MNSPLIPRLFPALLLALAACSPAASSPEEPPLAGASIGGPIALTDQDGRAFTDANVAGRYRIMYFGYTFCPDVCPVDVQNIAAGLRAFAKTDAARAAKVVPIFVTIDPARDTAPVVKQFVRAFDPNMVGLTGSPAQIKRTADEFGIYYARGKGNGDDYLMDHSRQAYLMDPNGKPLVMLPAEKGPEAVAEELAKWVK